jgi:uncharacterized cupin superfamily protein
MRIGPQDGIRVIRAADDLAWEEVPRLEGNTNPPGQEVAVFRSDDARFSMGFWRRVPEEGPMAPPYHEVALILEGEVEVTSEDGTVLQVGPGDLLITPKGTTATRKALSPVRKLWAVYKE